MAPRLRDLPRRFVASCRNHGLRFTLYHVLSDWLLPAGLLQFGTLVVLCRPADSVALEYDPLPGVRLATLDDAPLFAAIGARDARLWAERIRQGIRVWVVEHDGELAVVGATCSERRCYPLWLEHRGNPHDAWGSGMWVAPAQRRSGIGGRMLQHMIAACIAAGHARFLSLVESGNAASLRMQRGAGARQIGTLRYVRLLGCATVRAGGRWHVGFCSAARPLVVSVGVYDAAGVP
jgi:L-amino acid N-acyltransferase YncA